MTQTNNQKKAYLFAGIAVLFWSTVPTAFKIGLRYQDNYQMVTGATLISTLFLGIVMISKGKGRLIRSLDHKKIIFFALMGMLNPALYYFILFKAYDLLPGQVAQPLNMIWPIVLVIISIPLLKQKIGIRSIFSMVISFSGVIALSFQDGNLFNEISSIRGVLLALFTALLWAFYWIFNMKNKTDEIVSLFFIFLFSGIYLTAGSAFRSPAFPAGTEAWLSAAYIGLFEMGLAFVLWLKGLQLSDTTAKISNLVFAAPFINLIFVNTILGEEIYISTIFGIILVVTGIVLQNSAKRAHAE